MAAGASLSKEFLARILAEGGLDELKQRLRPDRENLPPRLPISARTSPDAVARRWQRIAGLAEREDLQDVILDEAARRDADAYAHHIENYIGAVRVPVGVAGPLRINGIFAKGDYMVPLATVEATLVASYARGAALLTAAGGCTTLLLAEAVGRSPAFAFESVVDAGVAVAWILSNLDSFHERVAATTSHGRLQDVVTTVEGNHVYLHLTFTTGDASGQNIVTLATQAVCDHILASLPVKPTRHFVEGNLSGDKKASAQSFTTVRGKKVTAEVTLDAELVARHLHATPRAMADYWRMSAMGGVLSGTVGVQGHFANGLAALYIACGQDAACVAESAVGVTRFELTDDGGLYATVTLPGIMVGTVGGGTGLPTQAACLDMLGLRGEGHSRAFAEVAAALVLAGELSIIGALSAGDFTRAHSKLARGKAVDGQ